MEPVTAISVGRSRPGAMLGPPNTCCQRYLVAVPPKLATHTSSELPLTSSFSPPPKSTPLLHRPATYTLSSASTLTASRLPLAPAALGMKTRPALTEPLG